MSAVVPWLVAALAAAAALRLHRADRARAELVARACHEVRGALTPARLAVEAARSGRSPHAVGGPLVAVDRELVRAADLLGDLAAAPRGGRPTVPADDVDVAQLLRRAAGAWRPAARLRGRDLTVVAPVAGLRVRGDARRLQQALSNLVANAVEHGAGPVVLAARAGEDGLRLEVADAGRGPTAPPGPGRGRGLAIAGDIAAAHGGALHREADGLGHRAALELPHPGRALTAGARPPAPAAGRPPTRLGRT